MDINNFTYIDNNYAYIDEKEDTCSELYYNKYNIGISHRFMDFIISECNIFSIKKILNTEIINSMQKYIHKYNKHAYRTIEDYNLDISTIRQRVQFQINDIENELYNLSPLFDNKILDIIYDFSIQKYDMYQLFEYDVLTQFYTIYGHLKTNISYNFVRIIDSNDEYIYNNSHFEIFIGFDFDLTKLLIYNNKFIFTNDFLFYLIDTLFDRINGYNFDKNFKDNDIYYDDNIFGIRGKDNCWKYPNVSTQITSNHYKYVILKNIIEIFTNINKFFPNSIIEYFYNKLNEIGVKKNDIIYTKLITLSENMEDIILLDTYNIDINYEYIVQNYNLTIEMLELFTEDKNFPNDAWLYILNNEHYLTILTDNFFIKYKRKLDIAKLIEKKECSINLLNAIKDLFTENEWNYIFDKYHNLPQIFLLENHNYLLIYLYRQRNISN